MAQTTRALVKHGVYYRENGELSPADFGEYEIRRTPDGHVRFRNGDDGAGFILTVDALSQYVVEGRIALAWEPIPTGEES